MTDTKDTPVTPGTGGLGFTGSSPRLELRSVLEWWVWNWRYLAVCILATVGSVGFCFVPGWGGAAGAVCTIIATGTGFKAGGKYRREVITRS